MPSEAAEGEIRLLEVNDELAAADGAVRASSGRTEIFITPGFRFQAVDALITNFHLPRSTLIALVTAMMTLGEQRRAYAEAIDQEYRFFSYGDAMFLAP